MPDPTLTDSILVALYEGRHCIQVAYESELLIDRLNGLWENEYYRRKKTEEKLGITESMYHLADSLRIVEQNIGIAYADTLGKTRKRFKAFKWIAGGGVVAGFAGGVLASGFVNAIIDSVTAWIRREE